MFAKFSTSARSVLLLPTSTHCGSRRAKILIRNQDYANLLFACCQLCAFQLNLDVGHCQSCAPFEKPAPGIWRSLFREVHGLILLILIQDCMFGLVWFRSLANSFNSRKFLPLQVWLEDMQISTIRVPVTWYTCDLAALVYNPCILLTQNDSRCHMDTVSRPKISSKSFCGIPRACALFKRVRPLSSSQGQQPAN